jgi:hypothetical protein
MLILPPVPLVEAPLAIPIEPDEPDEVEPVLNDKAPLVPDVDEGIVFTENEPLLVGLPPPVAIEIAPPVA